MQFCSCCGQVANGIECYRHLFPQFGALTLFDAIALLHLGQGTLESVRHVCVLITPTVPVGRAKPSGNAVHNTFVQSVRTLRHTQGSRIKAHDFSIM